MKRSQLKRGTPLPRTSRLSNGKRLRPVGKRGRAIRRELEKVRRLALERDGRLCRRCRDPLCKPLDLHHRRSRAQGGAHTLDNLVTLGRPCHDAVHFGHVPDRARWRTTTTFQES